MKFFKAVDRGYQVLLRILTALLAAVMFILVFTTTWQVLSRYICDSPQMWPTDIATYGLAFLTFIGMGVLLREDGHIRIDIVYLKLPDLAQMILDTIMDLVGVITLVTVAYYAFKLDLSYYQKSTFLIGSVFYMPKYIVFSFVPIGLTITAIGFIRRVVVDIAAFSKKAKGRAKKGK